MPYIYGEIFNLVNLINLASWKRDFKFHYTGGEKSIDYIETTGEDLEARWCIYSWKYSCVYLNTWNDFFGYLKLYTYKVNANQNNQLMNVILVSE